MRCPYPYAVWLLATLLIAVALFVVILYGHTFGYVKSVLWLVAFLISFGISALFFEPLKALGYAAFVVVFTKRTAFTSTAEPPKVLPVDDWIVYTQKYAAYKQLSSTARTSPAIDYDTDDLDRMRLREKYLLHYDTLTTDLIMFSLYLVTLLLVVLGTRDHLAYYSHRLASDYLVRGRYAPPGPHRPVLNETDFWLYLEHIVVPTLHPNQTGLRNTGWLPGKTTKLLGVARLRQLRVRTFCDIRSEDVDELMHRDCARHFAADQRETGRFSTRWSKFVDSAYRTQFSRITRPWMYQSAWESQSLPAYGDEILYEGGGYILPLGRTAPNSAAILRYARHTNWLDRRTVATFLELTLYSAQANLFNCISICAERTPLGNYLLTTNLQTVRLLFAVEAVSAGALLLAIAFVLCTVAFAIRLAMRVTAAGFSGPLRRAVCSGWTVLDMLVIGMSCTVMAMFWLRDAQVNRLLLRLQQSRNNQFVSFAYVAFADRLLTGWCSVLITAATVRLWKLLQFVRVFRVCTRTLRRAAPSLLYTLAAVVVWVVALAVVCRLLNGAPTREFSTMAGSVVALVVLACGFGKEGAIGTRDLMHGGRLTGGLLLAALTITVNVYLMSVLVMIVIEQLAETRRTEAEGDGEVAPFTYWAWCREGWREWWGQCGWRRGGGGGGGLGAEAGVTERVSGSEDKAALDRSVARMELLLVQMHLVKEMSRDEIYG